MADKIKKGDRTERKTRALWMDMKVPPVEN
jgi:hypothetical protein